MSGRTLDISPDLMALLGATQDGGVIVPAFVTKAITQSTPVADVPNTITITIETNVNLDRIQSSIVVISGLVGAVVSGTTVSLSSDDANVFCDNSNVPAQATWVESTHSLELHICTGEIMLPLTKYILAVTVRNPSAVQNSPNVSIEVFGSSTIGREIMDTPGTALFGIDKGTDPLKVVLPSFAIKNISQTSPVAALANALVVEILPNILLSASSVIEVNGLSGAIVPTSVS
eukprot:506291-Rhodomonas_salina.1